MNSGFRRKRGRKPVQGRKISRPPNSKSRESDFQDLTDAPRAQFCKSAQQQNGQIAFHLTGNSLFYD